MEYLAHISEDGRKQAVADHCRAAAGYAEQSLSEIGLGKSAYLCALLHDMGKMTQQFQDYISSSSQVRGSVMAAQEQQTISLTVVTIEWYAHATLITSIIEWIPDFI